MSAPTVSGPRPVRAARGTELSTLGWQQEAALRMLQNNLDPEVAEHPDNLVVYGGTGKAARDWAAFDALQRTLRTSRATRRCSCRRATGGRVTTHDGRRACSSPTPTWWATGPTGRSSAASSTSGSRCTAR